MRNIKRNFSTISWEPPFSLDLTNTDPNIIYCVEVYNITCGETDRVFVDLPSNVYVDDLYLLIVQAVRMSRSESTFSSDRRGQRDAVFAMLVFLYNIMIYLFMHKCKGYNE